VKVGLSNLLFPRVPVEEAISRTADLGADCVEIVFDIPHFPPEFDMKRLRSLMRLINSCGLDVSVHGSVWDINPVSYYSEVRALTLKQIKRSIDTCSALGGEIVVMHPGRCPMPEIGRLFSMSKSWFIKFTSECLSYAKKRGIKLTLENFSMSANHPYSYPKQMVGLARKLDGLGITFDIGHAFLDKHRRKLKAPEQEIAEEIKLVGKHLAHVHIHDNHGNGDEHLPPGKGLINFRPIMKALNEINYDGWLIVELWHPRLEGAMEVGRVGLRNTRKLLETS